MNNKTENDRDVTPYQLDRFGDLINRLYMCCQERMQYQSERFGLPDAELRCLLLFGEERYLTPKGIALKMNVVKSRVTRIIQGLLKKNLIHRVQDPEDSRVTLLSLTLEGQENLKKIRLFQDEVYHEVLTAMPSQQRTTILNNLETLKSSMEAVKEMMV